MIEDRIALKELVDTFSILADQKDTKTQSLLFSEDASLLSYVGDELLSQQHGRKEICDACTGFLRLFDTVYHLNGQQVVALHGDRATGTSYCQVVLIGKNEEGVLMSTHQGVWYEDEYVKVDGAWLIASRTSHFVWVEAKEA